ncbi:MAG: COX15/CtaA family protein [Actinomycetota bacterium]|nr:COX15/CtaA family protein [Actinomycetota bacterium]
MALPRTDPTVFRRTAGAAVLALSAIVVTGGAVRLTSSGLGCPTWPRCTDSSFVSQPEYAAHGLIEFGNRVVTVLVFLLIAALLVQVFRLPQRRTDLAWLSGGLLAGYVGQAVLGGLTVLYDLAAPLVIGHFLLSMLLLLDAVVLYARTGPRGQAGPATPRQLPWLAWLLAGTAALVLVAGTVVTGAGPHSGGSLHTPRLAVSIRGVAQLHADLAMLLTGLVVATVVTVHAVPASAAVRRAAGWLGALVVGQAALGFTQYFLGVPVGLVGLHIAGATAIWVVSLRLALALPGRDAGRSTATAAAG